MWADLQTELVELFSDVRIDRFSLPGRIAGNAPDPHPDADRWLEATPEEREEMRPSFEARLRMVRAEIAKAWKPRRRDRRAYMRALRVKSPGYRERDIARCRAWREKQKAKRAACEN